MLSLLRHSGASQAGLLLHSEEVQGGPSHEDARTGAFQSTLVYVNGEKNVRIFTEKCLHRGVWELTGGAAAWQGIHGTWLSSKLWLRLRAILAVKCFPKTEVTSWVSWESFLELVLLVALKAPEALLVTQDQQLGWCLGQSSSGTPRACDGAGKDCCGTTKGDSSTRWERT